LIHAHKGNVQEEDIMNRITETPSFITRIVGVVEADCPDDGGKWALMCEHFVDGEWMNAGIIQDTNKRNLATWVHAKRGAGYTTWCPECQDAHAVLEVK
jgi:hypothetical protein